MTKAQVLEFTNKSQCNLDAIICPMSNDVIPITNPNLISTNNNCEWMTTAVNNSLSNL